MRYIRCSNYSDINNQIFELNYIMYKKYFVFKRYIEKKAFTFINQFSKFYLLAIHIRMSDYCFKNCRYNISIVNNIKNMIKNELIQHKVYKIFLCSNSKSVIDKFNYNESNIITYLPKIKIKHSSKSFNITNKEISKIIGDIVVASTANEIYISGWSTYSLMILYKGLFENYHKCRIKKYKFWTNTIVIDHLDKFKNNHNKLRCKN